MNFEIHIGFSAGRNGRKLIVVDATDRRMYANVDME